MRLGVFGGSFDPVHLGHLIAAAEAHRALGLDQVSLIATGQHPWKTSAGSTPAADRLAMLRLAVEGDPRFVVDDREVRREGPSYTVETLRALRAERPGDRLSLLVGADAAGARASATSCPTPWPGTSPNVGSTVNRIDDPAAHAGICDAQAGVYRGIRHPLRSGAEAHPAGHRRDQAA